MAKQSKSVRAQINDLEVGASVAFPLERYDYVVSCRTRLQITTGKSFTSRMDSDNKVVVITREKDPRGGRKYNG